MWLKISVPANYTEEDPLDIGTLESIADDLSSHWFTESPQQQRAALANAFRAARLSPRQSLKWNSIVYQDLLHLPPDTSDPDLFEKTIREQKEKWDRFGQMTLDMVHQHSDDSDHIYYAPHMVEKYQPGIWKNVRDASTIGNYVEDVRKIAIEDIARGGTGKFFRQEMLDLGIPGIGPKITAFIWLLLNPRTSKIATIDVHMMRALGQKDESPATYADYLRFEQLLEDQKHSMGYGDVPLGLFQWAIWDKQRTPGWHQDHSALRPLNPIDWKNVDWAPQQRPPRKTEDSDPNQLSWAVKPEWSMLTPVNRDEYFPDVNENATSDDDEASSPSPNDLP